MTGRAVLLFFVCFVVFGCCCYCGSCKKAKAAHFKLCTGKRSLARKLKSATCVACRERVAKPHMRKKLYEIKNTPTTITTKKKPNIKLQKLPLTIQFKFCVQHTYRHTYIHAYICCVNMKLWFDVNAAMANVKRYHFSFKTYARKSADLFR